jgi:hypothetical protein
VDLDVQSRAFQDVVHPQAKALQKIVARKLFALQAKR